MGFSVWLTVVAVAVLGLLALLSLVLAGEDYYAILGLKRNAATKDIKKAYRELSRQYHPDKNPGDDVAADKFVKIARAYEVLSDDETRKLYDQYGEEGLKQQNSGFHDPFDIFSHFSSGFSGQGRQGQARGRDIDLIMEISLEEFYKGVSVDIEVNKQVLCDHCHGSGAAGDDAVETCPVCGGRGVKVVQQQMAPGFVMKQEMPCNRCNGKGKIIKEQCPHCKGQKVVRGAHILSVEVEKGMLDGQVLIFAHQADQGPDITPGDLRIALKQLSHPVFTRHGDNLYVTQPISLQESLLGFTKTLKHLDGHTVTLSRQDKITPSGFVETVENEGMPRRLSSEMGKLFVEYTVIYPASLTPKQREAAQAFFATK